jgi:hypothetical protein
MKILVCGLPKSGTTALTYQIKNSISSDYRLLFEPQKYEEQKDVNLICKIIFSPFRQDFVHYLDFKNFDKKIQLIRDPRDIIVSSLLYFGAWFELSKLNQNELNTILELIKEKESNPQSISILELFTRFKIKDFLVNLPHYLSISSQMNLIYNDLNILKYEDFIIKKTENLETYLDTKLNKDCSVDKRYSRVIRTKNSGNWRQWFTQEDINYFKPLLNDYLSKFDYSNTDWELNNQTIPSEFASDYIVRVIKDKK